MSDDDGSELSVTEFFEYCRTQARLLSGRAETMRSDVDDLLEEIDDDLETIRGRLTDHANDREGPTAGPAGTDLDVTELEELESTVETKQALVEAKQARLAAFQELAADYADLAAELHSEIDDGHEAMERVIRFELEHDAPVYFDDRQTVAEAAAESNDQRDE